MIRSLRLFFLRATMIACLLMMSGCATLSPSFEKPALKLVSVKLLPSQGFEQRLAIKLRITNTNSMTLPLSGLHYRLALQGYNLISGVTRDLESIAGYAETEVELKATVDWINGLRLLQSVIAQPDTGVSYELDAKLDPGRLLPAFHITERGIIELAPAQ